MTNLSIPLKDSMTFCVNYYFNETNFPSVRRWKLILEEQCKISNFK